MPWRRWPRRSRLAVFRLLVERGPAGYPAGEIGERLEIPGPTLSFHLKELAQAGLVTARKESRFVYYTANFEQMNALVAYLTENCCSLGVSCGAGLRAVEQDPAQEQARMKCSVAHEPAMPA